MGPKVPIYWVMGMVAKREEWEWEEMSCNTSKFNVSTEI